MRYILSIVGLLLSLTAYAQSTPSATAKEYVEGKDYVLIASPVPTITGDKIEITEVLRYAQVKSFHFESILGPWKKGLADDVELVRNPVIWNRDTATRARVYFTADVLGVGDAVNKKLFETMHVDVNYRALLKDNDIADMFESLGVSRDKFNKEFKSFVVNHKFNQAEVRVRSFGIESTPEIIVNGKYRITENMAGSQKSMVEVADFLIAKIRAEKANNQ